MPGAVAAERGLVEFALPHVDTVTERAALPGTLTLAGLRAEVDVEAAPHLRRVEPRQPSAPLLAAEPFALLDVRCRDDLFAVEILEAEGGFRGLLLGCELRFVALEAAPTLAALELRPDVLALEPVKAEADMPPLRPRQEETPANAAIMSLQPR